MTGVSRGLLASKSSTTRGRPPMMSFVSARGPHPRSRRLDPLCSPQPQALVFVVSRNLGEHDLRSPGA
jgi:hypothetical protein